MWIDVTVPIRSDMVVWSGDQPVKVERVADMGSGSVCNVSRLSMTSHAGTHMDAPLHFLADGAPLDALPIDAVVGPARVIEIDDEVAIKAAHLTSHEITAGQRILFKTRNSPRCWQSDTFTRDYVYIDPDAAEYLVERGVRTVGIDYLSVGGPGKLGVRTHRTLLGSGVWLIEGMDLTEVKPGAYELVCLPLRVVGADGAPARVVLRAI